MINDAINKYSTAQIDVEYRYKPRLDKILVPQYHADPYVQPMVRYPFMHSTTHPMDIGETLIADNVGASVVVVFSPIKARGGNWYLRIVPGGLMLVGGLESDTSSGDVFDPEEQVKALRTGGRRALADKVAQILLDIAADPDEENIQLFSLGAMVSFLLRHKEFQDPFPSPDPSGLMTIEWHINDNGLLVLVFVESAEVICVAQSDTISRSERMTEEAMLEEFGHLVPTIY